METPATWADHDLNTKIDVPLAVTLVFVIPITIWCFMKHCYTSCKRSVQSKFTSCLDQCQRWLNIKKKEPEEEGRALYTKDKDDVRFEGANMHYGEEKTQNKDVQNLIMKSNIKGVQNV